MDVPSSTIEGVETSAHGRLAIWTRRGFLTLLTVFVLAGVAGLLGVRTSTADSHADGWGLSLSYAATARAGLDVPWQVTVTHEGGFGKDLQLAVTGDYFDIYETQGFNPEPSDVTRDGDLMYLTFTAPPGDTFVLRYDAYIQPSSQAGAGGTVSVIDQGQRVVSVDFDTVLLP
ncbi:MAG TPA: twin-arginine translocation signal domain-containing protein [Nocardioidaceae bacterium]